MRLGFLYPDHAAEDDLPWLVETLFPDGSVVADVVHTSIGEDAHTVAALRETASRWRLREGTEVLRRNRADVAVWACTSGSFVFGLAGARRQAEALAEDFQGPASSTSLAFVYALAALDVRSIAIAASYPEPLARHFTSLLTEAGQNVVSHGSRGIFTAAEVGLLPDDEVTRFVCDADDDRAQAIVVPDTALHSVRIVDELERAVGKPVVTANQVSVWEALRLRGAIPRCPGVGSLFAQTTTVH